MLTMRLLLFGWPLDQSRFLNLTHIVQFRTFPGLIGVSGFVGHTSCIVYFRTFPGLVGISESVGPTTSVVKFRTLPS